MNNKNKTFSTIVVILVIVLVIVFSESLFRSILSNSAKKSLYIASTSPAEHEVKVGLYHPISINFTQAITPAQQGLLQVKINPAVKTAEAWSSDTKTLVLTPIASMHSGQVYTVNVTSQGITYSWSFATAEVKDVSHEDKLREQAQGDRENAAYIAAIYKTFPQFDKYPLKAQNYFVFYDVDHKRIVGKIYPQRNISTSVAAQVSVMKKEIEARVKQTGVDTKQFPIVWLIIPEH